MNMILKGSASNIRKIVTKRCMILGSSTCSSSEEVKAIDDTSKLVNTEEKKVKADRNFITPLAKKMIIENKIDLDLVSKGTGGNGRITKRDIQRVLADGLDYQSDSPTQVTHSSSVNVEAVGEGLRPMRKAIARNMRISMGQTAQLTLLRKANADNLIDFQKVLRKEIESAELNVKLYPI